MKQNQVRPKPALIGKFIPANIDRKPISLSIIFSSCNFVLYPFPGIYFRTNHFWAANVKELRRSASKLYWKIGTN